MTGAPKPEDFSLEGSVGYYLARARNVLLHRMDTAVAPLGLTPQQIGVMFQLSKGLARTPQELSRALAYDSGSMTRMLDRLEKKGFIARTRSEQDRRVVEIALTDAGRAIAAQLPNVCGSVMSEVLAPFSKDEVEILIRLLTRIAEHEIPIALSNASADDETT
ncbi:MarR family winged helix-turn-helix transcriptional regulator [Pararobbsia silviterrae]|uniref:MarR family transcriptional regulator n=1 Tax=Pararobbsia silviterrae TaxID=1792498 RepID=A0A494Y720_9BURK|nr:MarR family transcriptional regulator [Pararobbsia silviterrae]RKP58521.1 MarR family transcriptional regulator [Pararobbsia silviterrae]